MVPRLQSGTIKTIPVCKGRVNRGYLYFRSRARWTDLPTKLIFQDRRQLLWLVYTVLYRLTAPAIGLRSRTSRNSYNQVHLGNKIDMIASLRGGWFDCEFSSLSIHRHVHKAIECTKNRILFDPIRFQRICEIAKASWKRIRIAVEDTKCFSRAWRQKKIIATYCILDDSQ